VGVSVNTVSFVLNGSRSGTRVSEAKRLAIQEAAIKLGYRRNNLATSFRLQRTDILGLFIDFDFLSPMNPFLSELVGGLQQACAEAGKDLLLHTHRTTASEDHLLSILADNRVDGLFFFAPERPELARLLAECSVPVVALVDRIPNLPSCSVDDYLGGQLQADFLYRKGHQKVMYRRHFNFPTSARERYEGFRERAESHGIEIIDGDHFTSHVEASFSKIDTERLREGVTAIVVWEDTSAHLTADALSNLGYIVPNDILVIGYNGLSHALPKRWSIPTVRAPWRQVSAAAVKTLLNLIDGDPGFTNTRLPVEFIESPS
jgi:DNA-binding LacI/PurR family transcriptional regulator